ncbi:DUF6252 family protein [Flavobacterium sp.]|uniref:DUF6252 family protein n=1 Tax=Flavobacterium sp. TaxID=239 RepID=UPI0035290E05
MKKINLLVTIFSILFLFSCSNDNEPVDPVLIGQTGSTGNGNFIFKADFNGTTWNANQASAQLGSDFITIAGINSTGDSFSFIIEANQLGTFPANENILSYNPASGGGYGYWSINVDNETEDTGSITITNINTANKTISGTFQFTGYWSNIDETSIAPLNFTNGVFQNIPYTGYDDPGADSFFAKVDGVGFTATDIFVATINEVIGIGASDDNDQNITVGVNENLGVGTYTITGNTSSDEVQATYEIGGNSILATSGSVTISTKTADRISGTFSFVATDSGTSYSITEGSFDVSY